MKLTADQRESRMPARLQAYERMAMLCERIKLDQLVFRLREPDMTVGQLRSVLMIGIQQELEHNFSQQIYVSGNLWKIIELAKNEALNTIVTTSDKFDDAENAGAYSNALIAQQGSSNLALNKAKEAIRTEAELLF